LDTAALARIKLEAERILKDVASRFDVDSPEVEVRLDPLDPTMVLMTVPERFILSLASNLQASGWKIEFDAD
jgi:hypothetical protein